MQVLRAVLSMLLISATAMAAGEAIMLAALFLVGLFDWPYGRQITVVGERGTIEKSFDN